MTMAKLVKSKRGSSLCVWIKSQGTKQKIAQRHLDSQAGRNWHDFFSFRLGWRKDSPLSTLGSTSPAYNLCSTIYVHVLLIHRHYCHPSFFFQFCASFWNHFPSAWRNSFNIYTRTLEKIVLNFCLSENAFVLPSVLISPFCCHFLIEFSFFLLLSHFTGVILLSSGFHDSCWNVSHQFYCPSFLNVMCFFLRLKIFPLFLVWSLTVIWGVVSLNLFYLRLTEFVNLSVCVFNQFENLSNYHFKYFFEPLLYLLLEFHSHIC